MSYVPEELFKLLFDQNRVGPCKKTFLKAKMGLKDLNNEKILK